MITSLCRLDECVCIDGHVILNLCAKFSKIFLLLNFERKFAA